MATPPKDSPLRLSDLKITDFKFELDKYDINMRPDMISQVVRDSMRNLQAKIPIDRVAVGPITSNMEHDVVTDTYKLTYTTQTVAKADLPKGSLAAVANKLSMWQMQWAQNVLRQPSGFSHLFMQDPRPSRETPRGRNTLEEIERILEVCDAVMQASQDSSSESQS